MGFCLSGTGEKRARLALALSPVLQKLAKHNATSIPLSTKFMVAL